MTEYQSVSLKIHIYTQCSSVVEEFWHYNRIVGGFWSVQAF